MSIVITMELSKINNEIYSTRYVALLKTLIRMRLGALKYIQNKPSLTIVINLFTRLL
jgi:hypothetical protein